MKWNMWHTTVTEHQNAASTFITIVNSPCNVFHRVFLEGLKDCAMISMTKGISFGSMFKFLHDCRVPKII